MCLMILRVCLLNFDSQLNFLLKIWSCHLLFCYLDSSNPLLSHIQFTIRRSNQVHKISVIYLRLNYPDKKIRNKAIINQLSVMLLLLIIFFLHIIQRSRPRRGKSKNRKECMLRYFIWVIKRLFKTTIVLSRMLSFPSLMWFALYLNKESCCTFLKGWWITYQYL